MAEPPRSSGTESVETYRDTLSKLLKTNIYTTPEAARKGIYEELLEAGPEGETIEQVALSCRIPIGAVLDVLDLPPETPPDKVVSLKVAADPPVRRRAPRKS